jgi:nucleotide-binding universal stress UspA family protein
MRHVNRILVATDFSKHAEKAVESGVFLAKTFGASIDLVHAIAMPFPVITPYDISLPATFLDDTRRAAREQLRATADKIKAEGVEVRIHLSNAAPAEAIVASAKELESDLIVMGTHGYTGLRHALLGSVAERTLRTAPCAVLTLKADDLKDLKNVKSV